MLIVKKLLEKLMARNLETYLEGIHRFEKAYHNLPLN